MPPRLADKCGGLFALSRSFRLDGIEYCIVTCKLGGGFRAVWACEKCDGDTVGGQVDSAVSAPDAEQLAMGQVEQHHAQVHLAQP